MPKTSGIRERNKGKHREPENQEIYFLNSLRGLVQNGSQCGANPAAALYPEKVPMRLANPSSRLHSRLRRCVFAGLSRQFWCLAWGAFTFHTAKSTSYLSNDPRSCVNCHVMRDEYDSWQKSMHHAAATCNHCHIPHAFLSKWLAKGELGWNNSVTFTTQDFHEPIQIKRKSFKELPENCIRATGIDFGNRRSRHADSGRPAELHPLPFQRRPWMARTVLAINPLQPNHRHVH